MKGITEANVLLALDAGLGETGWAIIHRQKGIHSGLIRIPGRRRLDAASRISQLIDKLDQLAVEWRPGAVAHSRPSGIHWPVPALELLESSLLRWCVDRGLPLHAYTAQEVRGSVTGHPNSSRDQFKRMLFCNVQEEYLQKYAILIDALIQLFQADEPHLIIVIWRITGIAEEA